MVQYTINPKQMIIFHTWILSTLLLNHAWKLKVKQKKLTWLMLCFRFDAHRSPPESGSPPAGPKTSGPVGSDGSSSSSSLWAPGSRDPSSSSSPWPFPSHVLLCFLSTPSSPYSCAAFPDAPVWPADPALLSVLLWALWLLVYPWLVL